MRIIKNPNPVEEIEKTCPECECEFAYTDGDIKTYVYSNDVIGPGYYGYRKKYILCPNCGKEIVLEERSSSNNMEPSSMIIDVKKFMEELVEPGDNIEPNIEDFTMFPHLENPDEENGE